MTVEYSKRDRYGRTLGKILVGGIDANLAQIRAGMAWHYKQYQRDQSFENRQLYSEAEDAARSSHRGLWADAAPTPPWDWRKQQRTRK
ncbi:thermonuclease family protein [Sideroxydans sp.]